MLLREAMDAGTPAFRAQIYATDLDEEAIAAARIGRYPKTIASDLSPQRLERFFFDEEAGWRVKKEVREMVVFAVQSVVKDPPFTRMDLVSCRNTLIYFRSPAQERAVQRLQYAVKPGGALFLGSSESLGDLQRDFQTLSARHKIWQVVRPTALPLDLGKTAPYPLVAQTARRPVPSLTTGTRHTQTVVEQGFSTLLRAFTPPSATSRSCATSAATTWRRRRPCRSRPWPGAGRPASFCPQAARSR
jgi:two-component system CheB/CheR fusion protein